ncbi:MAG: hypothetical protein K9L31_02910 [Candidatus Pacebacteria bacterium]|nr:hypothetical protein [Candidatus Paceibacterota bacterium]
MSSQKITGPSENVIILTAFRTFVIKDEEEYDLCDYFGFQDSSCIEICTNIWMLLVNLNITPEIKRVVINFLCSQHVVRDKEYDCYLFVCEYYKIENHKKKYLMEYWELKKQRFWPKVGDVLFLLDTSKQVFKHAAIYVGYGLYVSIYGAGGDIHFATLKDMKKSFGGKDIFLATPRF